MWRRMNTVSDCAGSKTTSLPEEHGGMIINGTEHGGMIINGTGTAVHRVLEKK